MMIKKQRPMRIGTFVMVSAVLSIGVAIAACSTGDAVPQLSSPRASVWPTPRVEIKSSPTLNTSIRFIDFTNFTYPAKPIFSGGSTSFTLQQGRYEGTNGHDPVNLAYLAYGDVTGDGVEEAMVILGVSIRGTAIPHTVYIYTLQNDRPKLLWAFKTGDRVDGGLRQVYAQDGALVVEQYFNPDTLTGECPACPTHFTRVFYELRENNFQQKGEKEILPNPSPHSPASPVMPRYHPS